EAVTAARQAGGGPAALVHQLPLDARRRRSALAVVLGGRGARRDGAHGLEPVGHPDLRVLQVVRGEVAPQEDRSAAPAGAALDEVAGDLLGPEQVEARLEVV